MGVGGGEGGSRRRRVEVGRETTAKSSVGLNYLNTM